MLRLREYLCRHDFKYTAKHRSTSQNLWKCKKCGVFLIQHYGIGAYYKSKTPLIDGWIYEFACVCGSRNFHVFFNYPSIQRRRLRCKDCNKTYQQDGEVYKEIDLGAMWKQEIGVEGTNVTRESASFDPRSNE